MKSFKFLQRLQRFNRRFGAAKYRELLIENLSLLMTSGMDLGHALDAISGELKSKRAQELINILKLEVEGGSAFWRALERVDIFPEHTISLLKIGEQSGRLVVNLKMISSQQVKEKMFRSQLRSAMLYPTIVLGLAVVIGIGISWFVLPRLSVVFSQLNVDLPGITRFTLGVGEFLSVYGTVVVPSFLAMCGLVYYGLFVFSKTKYIGQGLLFALPGVKGLIRDLELARFGYLLGTLLQAGVPIPQALKSVEDSTNFLSYKRLYRHLALQIDEGQSFQHSFAAYPGAAKYVPGSVQGLITAGEQSGSLVDSLLKLSASFEAKTETATKNLTVILEPFLLVIVWLAVLGVALSVILPIYGLIGGFNAGL